MNALTRWNQFKELEDLQNSLGSLFGRPHAAPMHKGNDGIWRLSVPLGPGRYEYRFYADGVWEDDPSAQQRAANALGTENCVRIVPA